MKKLFLLGFVLLINLSAWSQTASSYYVTSVEIANTTLKDNNWVNELAKFVSGINEIASMFNTGVVMYKVDRLSSLEEQLLEKAHIALSNETIRHGETWQVLLDHTPMQNAPKGTRAYTFFFHRESNGELYYLAYRRDKY